MSIGTRKDTLTFEHQGTALGRCIVRIGGKDFLTSLSIRPSTPTIYNVATADANWTAVATGLTDVLAWRLSEASGADFDFAFVAAPATFATAFGWIGDQSDISDLYVRRKGATNINAQLIVWTA